MSDLIGRNSAEIPSAAIYQLARAEAESRASLAPMSRRGGASEDATGERSPRERSDSVSSGAGSSGAASTTSPQFATLHSRVGKRYQAVIPELLASPADCAELLYKKQALQQPRLRYCPDKAEELGVELDKYLKLARSLRDGATFDTQEQVMTLALQHLHRFDYNPTDAACSLYARHSIELPRSAVNQTTTKLTAAEEAKKWLLAFYRCMRCTEIDGSVLEQMCELHENVKRSRDVIPVTEAGVLARLVTRILTWRKQCEAVSKDKVDRARLLQLLHQAEDMQVVLPEKETVVSRLRAFDTALTQLKEALEHSSKRHQSKKAELKELDALFEAVMAPQLIFPEESTFRETVDEANELKSTIDKMLAEDKVSLPVIRDVLTKIELVPVNFEQEVEQFQNKMLSAQTWLAKARKCMPNRRATRRAGGADTKKMDLEAIRALVDDAPCENSTEMFEMQDLLECADEWAVKVKEAIDGGADVTLKHLKELLDEAKDIPVIMDEQKFLEAEIAAREWCTTAASKLASRKSIEEMEDLISQAKIIRERIHPKKQSRWKPQVERDINSAMEQARKWINELRDNLGVAAFDKLFSSLSSYVPSPHSSRGSSSTTTADRANKKSMDAISKLIEKSQVLGIDVSSYTTPLNDLLLKGVEAQAEASAILMSIGCLSGTIASDSRDEANNMDIDSMPRELGDLAQASALLEKIDAFPFTFEEGINLASIVEGEKDWAARVRECIPPRQSRKKRLANDSFTTDQLHELMHESKRLRFHFREELRILAKELHDLTVWRAKAHEVIDGEVSASVANVVERLRSFDLLVYDKLQKAKKKLHIGDVIPTVSDKENNGSTDVDMSSAPSSDTPKAIKKEGNDVSAMDVDAEGSIDSVTPTQTSKEADAKPDVVSPKDKLNSTENGVQAEAAPSDTKPTTANGAATMNMQALDIHVDSIMTQIRIESGCMQKSAAKEEEESGDESKTSWMAKNGQDLLEPILVMAEDSFEAVDSLELKEAEARQTVEELVLAGEEGDITENITDECVRALDGWKQQLLHVQKESDLLSVEAPEQKVICLIISLLEWLQGSRSLFYDEILPLQNLVVKGDKITDDLREIKSLDVVKPEILETLERMLWPLPYLKTHEKVVLEWTECVHKCVADKHARVNELQTLLDNGSGLLLEQGAFKIVMDEAKKARLWLSKLKKRLRALMTKGVGRMSISAARSLVEEGEDIAIDMPVFDFLKEHLEIASDWETRVLASGIETGQARVANLLALLNEYECARLVIDLDMHRDVLKSATERYCICRQPFDGLMIGCDHCDDWFHDGCIGMSKEKAEKVEHYTCPSCTILQELAAMLHNTKSAGQQSNLWDMQEYAKAFEKHQASALRKVKREEKTVERTEMLLFSCNNQMNQLRARIDDIERAKACLTIKPVVGNGAITQHQASKQSPQLKQSVAQSSSVVSSSPTTPVPMDAPAKKTVPSVSVPVSAVGTNALLLAAAAASTTTTASTSSNSTATPSAAAASTFAGINMAALNRQQYPSILIPPMRAANNILKSGPKAEAVTNSTTTTKVDGAVTVTGVKNANDLPNGSSKTDGSAGSSSATPATIVSSTQQQAISTATIATTVATATPSTATTSVSVSTSGVQQVSAPQLLNPMAATLMGSTERLAALVVAGGVEQQLAKMKSEHVEASKQVLELQSSLRLSRDRLAHAQQALRELSDVFHARHRMLPYALAWVRQAVTVLNSTKTLSRANIDFSTFLPREYAAALSEMTQPAPASASNLTGACAMGIDKLFPGVDMYARLLRTVSWSQVVVSLLQERPSRGEISDAIAYATEYGLWEDKKIVTPLRSLIGRVDAWVSRAHKCMTKTANKTQQLSRLKVLMNEYSKLPLTYAKTAEPLNVYVKQLTGAGTKSKMKDDDDDEPLTPEAASVAATKALDEAMVRLSPSAISAANASGTGSMKKQAPRKRKAYTRKDKAPTRKKVKNPQGASRTAGSVPSTTATATTSKVVPTAGASPPSTST